MMMIMVVVTTTMMMKTTLGAMESRVLLLTSRALSIFPTAIRATYNPFRNVINRAHFRINDIRSTKVSKSAVTVKFINKVSGRFMGRRHTQQQTFETGSLFC